MKKTKMTKQKQRELEADFRRHNKRMAQTNNRRLQFSTLDDYVAYRYGTTRLKSVRRTSQSGDMTRSGIQYRETRAQHLPSLGVTTETKRSEGCKDATARKTIPEYSGEEITGIATSHKSNLLPVGRGTDPKIFATMRRGDGEIS